MSVQQRAMNAASAAMSKVTSQASSVLNSPAVTSALSKVAPGVASNQLSNLMSQGSSLLNNLPGGLGNAKDLANVSLSSLTATATSKISSLFGGAIQTFTPSAGNLNSGILSNIQAIAQKAPKTTDNQLKTLASNAAEAIANPVSFVTQPVKATIISSATDEPASRTTEAAGVSKEEALNIGKAVGKEITDGSSLFGAMSGATNNLFSNITNSVSSVMKSESGVISKLVNSGVNISGGNFENVLKSGTSELTSRLGLPNVNNLVNQATSAINSGNYSNLLGGSSNYLSSICSAVGLGQDSNRTISSITTLTSQALSGSASLSSIAPSLSGVGTNLSNLTNINPEVSSALGNVSKLSFGLSNSDSSLNKLAYQYLPSSWRKDLIANNSASSINNLAGSLTNKIGSTLSDAQSIGLTRVTSEADIIDRITNLKDLNSSKYEKTVDKNGSDMTKFHGTASVPARQRLSAMLDDLKDDEDDTKAGAAVISFETKKNNYDLIASILADFGMTNELQRLKDPAPVVIKQADKGASGQGRFINCDACYDERTENILIERAENAITQGNIYPYYAVNTVVGAANMPNPKENLLTLISTLDLSTKKDEKMDILNDILESNNLTVEDIAISNSELNIKFPIYDAYKVALMTAQNNEVVDDSLGKETRIMTQYAVMAFANKAQSDNPINALTSTSDSTGTSNDEGDTPHINLKSTQRILTDVKNALKTKDTWTSVDRTNAKVNYERMKVISRRLAKFNNLTQTEVLLKQGLDNSIASLVYLL